MSAADKTQCAVRKGLSREDGGGEMKRIGSPRMQEVETATKVSLLIGCRETTASSGMHEICRLREKEITVTSQRIRGKVLLSLALAVPVSQHESYQKLD